MKDCSLDTDEGRAMTSVVLDTNELQQDWLCTGLKFQLIRHAQFYPPVQFFVPALVLEEVVANHRREVAAAHRTITASNRKLRRLGLDPGPTPSVFLDYRQYLTEHFDEILGINVLTWPEASHESLVHRAVARRPPFDDRGGGYRDALIWSDVLALAARGGNVILVSSDKAFGDADGLTAALQDEVEPLSGNVELVRDFASWLLGRLPWKADALSEAVIRSRTEEFTQWFLASDFQTDLEPKVEDLGLHEAPADIQIVQVHWDGTLERVGEREASDGLGLIEFDIGQTVEIEASFPSGTDVKGLGEVVPGKWVGTVGVRGNVDMIVRVGVLYDNDYWGVEELAWRRADGTGPGFGFLEKDQNQPPMF